MTTTAKAGRGPDFERLLRQERWILDVTDAISERMNADEIDTAALGKRIGLSEAAARSLLEGGSELTLRRVADIGHALGAEPQLTFRKAAGDGRLSDGTRP